MQWITITWGRWALRELRESAGLGVESAALRLDWSASKLSRIECGQQGALRDTKDRSRAPHRHALGAWAEFVAGVRAGEFDRP